MRSAPRKLSRSPLSAAHILAPRNQKGDQQVDRRGREAFVNYSLAMSQIVKRGDISAESIMGLDEDERRMFLEMTNKLGKEQQTELNQVLNSAIA